MSPEDLLITFAGVVFPLVIVFLGFLVFWLKFAEWLFQKDSYDD